MSDDPVHNHPDMAWPSADHKAIRAALKPEHVELFARTLCRNNGFNPDQNIKDDADPRWHYYRDEARRALVAIAVIGGDIPPPPNSKE